MATLAGAANYREIGSHAADMPQELLKKLGASWSWFRLRYKHPGKSTIRCVLTRIDAAMLDAITCTWIFTQAGKDDDKGELVIALDGKVLRVAWTDENDKVTLFSAVLHDEAATVAQVRMPDGINDMTHRWRPSWKPLKYRTKISPVHDGRCARSEGDGRGHWRESQVDYLVTP